MAALARLLYPVPDLRRSPITLLAWWERRRPAYNLIVGVTGLVTVATIELLSAVMPGLTLHVPLIAIVGYGVAANLCYSLGFVLEATCEWLWEDEVAPVGPVLFRQGLLFSVGLTLLPIGIVWMGWLALVLRYLLR